jgi:chromosome partitioning protein
LYVHKSKKEKPVIVTVAHHKGGVGKTTTAIHLAAYLQTLGPTLLLDGDSTRSATKWNNAGPGLPFRIADEVQAAKLARQFEHVVIDTGQKVSDAELKELADGCDLLVIPAVPLTMETDGLMDMLTALAGLGATNYRVLIVKDPPPAEPEGAAIRADLEAQDVPLFSVGIPRVKAFEHARSQGVTVRELKDPRAKRAWAAYEAAGREVLGHG